MQQIRKNKWDIVRDQRKTFMSIEKIASMSHRVSIVPCIVGVKEVFFFNYEVPLRTFSKKYILSLWIWAWIFFRTSLAPSITYILVINTGWAVFKKIRFFDFSKFVYKLCKKFFFELILGVNLFCHGSHLPSQYGSNPDGVPDHAYPAKAFRITFFTDNQAFLSSLLKHSSNSESCISSRIWSPMKTPSLIFASLCFGHLNFR